MASNDPVITIVFDDHPRWCGTERDLLADWREIPGIETVWSNHGTTTIMFCDGSEGTITTSTRMTWWARFLRVVRHIWDLMLDAEWVRRG